MIRWLISIGTAYLVMQFASIMDYVQALFSFFIAPCSARLFWNAVEACDRPAASWAALWHRFFHRYVGG